jgi:hypothetical protein
MAKAVGAGTQRRDLHAHARTAARSGPADRSWPAGRCEVSSAQPAADAEAECTVHARIQTRAGIDAAPGPPHQFRVGAVDAPSSASHPVISRRTPREPVVCVSP